MVHRVYNFFGFVDVDPLARVLAVIILILIYESIITNVDKAVCKVTTLTNASSFVVLVQPFNLDPDPEIRVVIILKG